MPLPPTDLDLKSMVAGAEEEHSRHEPRVEGAARRAREVAGVAAAAVRQRVAE